MTEQQLLRKFERELRNIRLEMHLAGYPRWGFYHEKYLNCWPLREYFLEKRRQRREKQKTALNLDKQSSGSRE